MAGMNHRSMPDGHFPPHTARFSRWSVHNHSLFNGSTAVYFYTSVVTSQYCPMTNVAIVANTHITYQYRVLAYVGIVTYFRLSISETAHHLSSPGPKILIVRFTANTFVAFCISAQRGR
jgi:hypothetical protein